MKYWVFGFCILLVSCTGLPSSLEPLGKKPTGLTKGKASVFISNPVQSSGDQSLTDQKDAAAAVPASAYYEVALTNLDGSGYLRGDWANVRSTTGNAAYAADGVFRYTRNDDRFEQVMAYFWVTEAQRYLQSLGFGSDLDPVNLESQDVRINQYGQDNSFSWSKHDYIRLGKGGVDDAEDGEVIVHEYGHAVHDAQVDGFGASLEAGAIGEAFGDYLAVTVGLVVAAQHGVAVNAPAACVADWDAVSYTRTEPHCLRRIDKDKHYPDDLTGRIHADGEIWSRALWDIRQALGATGADRIIINAQFGFAADTSFSTAAKTTYETALLMYGAAAANSVKTAFNARGINF